MQPVDAVQSRIYGISDAENLLTVLFPDDRDRPYTRTILTVDVHSTEQPLPGRCRWGDADGLGVHAEDLHADALLGSLGGGDGRLHLGGEHVRAGANRPERHDALLRGALPFSRRP